MAHDANIRGEAGRPATMQPLCGKPLRLLATRLADHPIDPAAEGAEGIELDLGHAAAPAERLAAAADSNRFLVVTCGIEVQLPLPAAAAMRELAGRAAGAGAKFLNVRPVLPTDTPPAFESGANALHAALKDIRYDIEASGLELTVEAPGDRWLTSPVELRGFVDRVNCWAVGVCLDARRMHHDTVALDWLYTLARRVRLIRLQAPAASVSLDNSLGCALDRIQFTGFAIAG